MMKRLLSIIFLVFAVPGFAQDFSAAPPLPDLPRIYETTEYTIQVDQVAGGLSNPWSIAFLPALTTKLSICLRATVSYGRRKF